MPERKSSTEFSWTSSLLSTLSHALECEDGVERWLINWRQNYFSNRRQNVKFGNKASTSLTNNCGVKQGAVLSLFLFNNYMSSLRSLNDVTLIKYADDFTLCNHCKTNGDSQQVGQAVTELLELSSVECIKNSSPLYFASS